MKKLLRITIFAVALFPLFLLTGCGTTRTTTITDDQFVPLEEGEKVPFPQPNVKSVVQGEKGVNVELTSVKDTQLVIQIDNSETSSSSTSSSEGESASDSSKCELSYDTREENIDICKEDMSESECDQAICNHLGI